MNRLRTPRSLLYVPAHNDNLVGGAARRGAHAIILDLEDSVPDAAKEQARQSLPESVGAVAAQGAQVFVRSNSGWSLAWRDLEAAATAGAQGVMLTKVDSPAKVEALGEYAAELEARLGLDPLALLVTVESARGLAAVQGIAAALARMRAGSASRLTALTPGNEDLSLSLQVRPEPELMAGAIWPLITAARAYGHALFGSIGSGAGYRDLEAYRQRIELGRAYGFDGATCIHPAQVEVVNDVYRPSDAELEWAGRVATAFEAGAGEAVGVDGQMIDRPVYLRAKRLLGEADR